MGSLTSLIQHYGNIRYSGFILLSNYAMVAEILFSPNFLTARGPEPVMRLLVISDIHAYTNNAEQSGDAKPSYVKTGAGIDCASAKFEKFIASQPDWHPDVVICPGDLGHTADPTGIQYAWDFLNRLRGLPTKPVLLATVGNHDLNSRFQAGDFDPKGILQSLSPSFPMVGSLPAFDEEAARYNGLCFWAENFYTVVIDGFRFVVLNSAAFHGYGAQDDTKGKVAEYEHGRISSATISSLKAVIKKQNTAFKAEGKEIGFNILVCHHHLVADGDIHDKDYSQMKGANVLMDMLSDTDFGRWLVIHGHRHRARFFDAGGSTAPFILSAGSFSATHDKQYVGMTPNQAHLLDLDLKTMTDFGFFPCGEIKSFTYTPGTDWIYEKGQSGGLPPRTGFGYRGPLEPIVSWIDKTLTDTVPVKWATLVAIRPELIYLDYFQVEQLQKLLSKVGIKFELDEDKYPSECGRTK